MNRFSPMFRRLCLVAITLACAVISSTLLAAPLSHSADQQGVAAVEQIQAAPDLVIKSITLVPPNPGAGSQADITVNVKNQGDAPVLSGQRIALRIYVQPGDDPPLITTAATKVYTHAIGLLAGDDFQYSILGQTIPQANPKIYAWVDRDNLIPESNETNNLFPPPVNPDAFEQDDTCLSAKMVPTDGSVQTHNLAREGGVADEDWLKFSVQSGVKYVARADAIGADADLILELYPGCDTFGTPGRGAVITFTASADSTYFVKVGHNANVYGPATDYKFGVTAIRPMCNRSLEPNDICGVSSDLALNTSAQSAAFCEANDVDWMRIAVKPGGQYTITAKNLGTQANVQLGVYPSCEAAASGTGEVVTFRASTQGYVYVAAQNANPLVFGADTEYSLQVNGTQGCNLDTYEPDNAVGGAQPLRLNGNPQPHTICGARDVDWVKFEPSIGMTYTIETLNLGERADTILCLHDANGQELRCNDDDGPGRGSRMTVAAATTQPFFFSIRDRDPGVAGEDTRYDVRLFAGLCQGDANEPDNSQAAAKALTVGGAAQPHNICPADDEDWSSFTASANTNYVISTVNTGPEADTIVELYDAAGRRLAINDDHAPGITSQIVYRTTDAGQYLIRTQLFNPERNGTGTEYGLSVASGSPQPTPTPGPTPTPQPSPTPGPPTSVETLILVNRTRLAQLHGEAKVTELMSKLSDLAHNPNVKGEMIRLDNNTEISARYAAWQSDETSVAKANLVTDAIRRVVQTYLLEHDGVKYVVLVGDDRALPMRRVPDGVPSSPEREYADVDSTNAVGAAIHENHYATDDFFVDRQPTQIKGHEVYIPDLAIGRLIETPDDMIHLINGFLGVPNGTVQVDNILVTGYDFVNDVAQQNCNDWRKAMNNNNDKIACLIDQPTSHWTKQQLMDFQLRPNPVFKIQSINGHAFHSGEGTAAGGSSILRGSEIGAVAALDFGGGIIYTLGCHSGLNVPPTNGREPLDLPEAFARKGANYIGNTGFGYGLLNSIGLSETLMRLYTAQLISSSDVTMGRALMVAKKQYFQRNSSLSAYDEKVMQQLIFYGLPMYKISGLQSTGTLGDDFPGVDFNLDPPSLGGEVISRTVRINFQRAIDSGALSRTDTESGEYLSLSGSTSGDANEPIHPLHFASLSGVAAPARSVVVLGGDIEVSQVADPLIGTPVNEYLPRGPGDEASLTRCRAGTRQSSAPYKSSMLRQRSLRNWRSSIRRQTNSCSTRICRWRSTTAPAAMTRRPVSPWWMDYTILPVNVFR